MEVPVGLGHHHGGPQLLEQGGDIRKRWNVNVIGRKEEGAIRPIDASFVFAADTHILVAAAGTWFWAWKSCGTAWTSS